MTPEDFQNLCDALGLETEYSVHPDELDGDGQAPLNATNNNGDTLYFRKSLDADEWVLELDLGGYTFDENAFDMSDVTISGDSFTIENVSGTRPSSGYGNTGFAHADLHVDADGAKIVETH